MILGMDLEPTVVPSCVDLLLVGVLVEESSGVWVHIVQDQKDHMNGVSIL